MKKDRGRTAAVAAVITLILLTILPQSVSAQVGEVQKNEKNFAVAKNDTVCLGGMPFGVRLYSEGISVVGFSDVDTECGAKNPGAAAGIRENDVIISVDQVKTDTVEDFISVIEGSNGADLAVSIRRGEDAVTVRLKPELSLTDGKYKAGIWVKDSTAGIGTVTFILPKTGAFAGLGHSIGDPVTGMPMKLKKGVVCRVDITGVEKGIAGTPGELKGTFLPGKTGTLVSNTDSGIFGIFGAEISEGTDLIPVDVASETDVSEGEATVRCTVGTEGTSEYSVKVSEVKLEKGETKNFVVEVTDNRLLENTGGIVQGMSGSPIIQDGKLIGAVTHVFVSDPKKGYGIAVWNMMDKMPRILK